VRHKRRLTGSAERCAVTSSAETAAVGTDVSTPMETLACRQGPWGQWACLRCCQACCLLLACFPWDRWECRRQECSLPACHRSWACRHPGAGPDQDVVQNLGHHRGAENTSHPSMTKTRTRIRTRTRTRGATMWTRKWRSIWMSYEVARPKGSCSLQESFGRQE